MLQTFGSARLFTKRFAHTKHFVCVQDIECKLWPYGQSCRWVQPTARMGEMYAGRPHGCNTTRRADSSCARAGCAPVRCRSCGCAPLAWGVWGAGAPRAAPWRLFCLTTCCFFNRFCSVLTEKPSRSVREHEQPRRIYVVIVKQNVRLRVTSYSPPNSPAQAGTSGLPLDRL